ncbi:hypothetical protein P280DRAFT_467528 [Massarina eburnea CBS 473.64]|uniref:Protein YAE1 n=1 Tax=Massarina eburnea CBS 473.64 TaxID=1395130 RepID=A0A6A6S9C6_9PLEO|nr:hypothetical protein P280DRAFT_467528 [Massarina eburnea CBS 473.64]
MLCELSPNLGPIALPAGNAPPTPPHNDPLDDIYGSEPSSPVLSSQNLSRPEEILSDLPSRQRALDTDAYREGLSNSKGQFVQEGFDEGYSLGANIGLLVGYVIGVLQGFTTALSGHDEARWEEAKKLWEEAQRELVIENLLGQKWIDEEGIWKWEVEGKDDEVTFREVAEQHPVMKTWMGRVKDTAEKWKVDLEAVERGREDDGDADEQS